MSRRFTLKRYADQGRLRRVRFGLLKELLAPHMAFLEKRGFAFAATSDAFDYDGLAAILREPGRDTPGDLIDALFLLDDLSDPVHSDRLAELAKSLGVDLPEDYTSEDAATAIYLADSEALRNLQFEIAPRSPRKYDFFAPRNPSDRPVAPKNGALMDRVARDLDGWFTEYGKGRGNVSIQTSVDGPTSFVTIRHGGNYKRASQIDTGKLSTIAFRPPEYDVLLFELATGMVGINLVNKSKRQQAAFLRILGRHFLGINNVYEPAIRHTFEPLWRDGAASMRCDDVPDLEWARVSEWEWRRVGVNMVRTVNVGVDLFAEMEQGAVAALTKDTQFTMAKFVLKFTNHPHPRAVTLRGSNTAEYMRDEDAPVVEDWLSRRGFLLSLCKRTREARISVA